MLSSNKPEIYQPSAIGVGRDALGMTKQNTPVGDIDRNLVRDLPAHFPTNTPRVA